MLLTSSQSCDQLIQFYLNSQQCLHTKMIQTTRQIYQYSYTYSRLVNSTRLVLLANNSAPIRYEIIETSLGLSLKCGFYDIPSFHWRVHVIGCEATSKVCLNGFVTVMIISLVAPYNEYLRYFINQVNPSAIQSVFKNLLVFNKTWNKKKTVIDNFCRCFKMILIKNKLVIIIFSSKYKLYFVQGKLIISC